MDVKMIIVIFMSAFLGCESEKADTASNNIEWDMIE
jgi:hypothetical protein